MKTFFEFVLDEVARKLEREEINEETAKKWIEEIREKISEAAKTDPHHPAIQMPVGH